MLQDSDPTQGYVNYVDQLAAYNCGLISIDKKQIYIGVDSTNIASGRGRDSVRLASTASYNHGLFMLDVEHMPGSICGTWPALYVRSPVNPGLLRIDRSQSWLVGPDWVSTVSEHHPLSPKIQDQCLTCPLLSIAFVSSNIHSA